MGALAELEEFVAGLNPAEKAELDSMLEKERNALWLPEPENKPQVAAYVSLADELLFGGSPGSGKALALDTPILTVSGWKTMGSLSIGDVLFDESGKPCRIIAASPVMIGRPCFDVRFSCGASIVADADHRWSVLDRAGRLRELKQTEEWRSRRRAKRPSRGTGRNPWLAIRNAELATLKKPLVQHYVLTTTEISQSILSYGRLNYSIPIARAIKREGATLPIDPYLMGAWLGDGSTYNSRITIAESQMVDLVSAAASENGWGVTKGVTKLDYGIVGGMKVALREVGVLGAKTIPALYLSASIHQRIALLQGLMDSDGYASATGMLEFTSTNLSLATGALELIRSLGCQANMGVGVATLRGREIGPKYRICFVADFPAFRLSRKLARQRTKVRSSSKRRFIEAAEPVDSVPVRCIAVDSLSRLFLCGRELIPTHNTDLIIGLALTEHTNSVIYRANLDDMAAIRERLSAIIGKPVSAKGTRIRGHIIELAHLAQPGSEQKQQGRPRDLIAFDEAAQLAKKKVMFVIGWKRSAKAGQRCRVVFGSNPPTSGEGEWIIEWFAPWLDPTFPDPAKIGELRLFVSAPDEDATTIWVKDPRPVIFTEGLHYRLATEKEIEANKTEANPRLATPLTRTFIPGWLKDNPYLANTDYGKQLQRLPEPLRTQLIRGDFQAGRRDHLWQVIKTDYVKAAMARWTAQPPNGAVMSAIAADVAQGGADNTVIARRHGPWFAELIKRPGAETPKPSDVAGMIISNRRNAAVVIVDMGGGYGGGVKERLEENGIEVRPFNGANESGERTIDGQLRFVNRRAEATWRFREALEEENSQIALPNDPELLGDLTALRWKMTTRGIQIESKEELREAERLGRSPDKGDAVIEAWSEGEKALVAAQRKRDKNKPIVPAPGSGVGDGTGWLRG